MDHQVSLQSAEGPNRGAGTRCDPTNVRSAGCSDRERSRFAGSYPYVAVESAGFVTSEAGAVHKGAFLEKLQDEFPELRKRYWGQDLWARGYFCATVGAVNEQTIRDYIENQKWDEDDQGFKITAPET